MSTARKLPSGSWRCQVYSHTEKIKLPDGTTKDKRIYKSFTCDIPGPKGKRTCEAMAAEWAKRKEENANLERHVDITFGQALDLYIENRASVLSPATIREYKRSRNRDFKDLESKYINKITQEEIQVLVNKASLKHSPKTVRNIHGIISAVMTTYRPEFVLRTKLPEKNRPNLYTPSDEDVKQIISYLREKDNEMEIPVLLAAFGPMRRGEICGLYYEDISGNVVHVRRSLAYNDNHKWVEKSPKTYTSDRYIEFPPFVINRIGTGTGRIISYTPDALTQRFNHILKNAGVPHFRFHDLRHYCASILHALNMPDAYIMRRGGWATASVLDGIYRHAMDDKEKEMTGEAIKHFSELCNTKYNTNNEQYSK